MSLARIIAAGIAATAWTCLSAAQAYADPSLTGPGPVDRGTCVLNAQRTSGTYGFAAQGQAIGANPFVPVGPFSQAGVATLTATTEDESTVTGTWSVNLAQNDSSGYTPNVSFGGNFQVEKANCSGNFFIATPTEISEPSFRVVFVHGGDEVRVIAAIPNLIVSYSTAAKL